MSRRQGESQGRRSRRRVAACYRRSMSEALRSERRLLDRLRNVARDALGPGAPEAHVEFQARLCYESAGARPRYPGAVREQCIRWGIAPDPNAGRDWRTVGRDHKRRLACRRTWTRRRRGLQLVFRTGLLDRSSGPATPSAAFAHATTPR